jgi:hypothetical protein
MGKPPFIPLCCNRDSWFGAAGRPSRNIYHWPKHGRYREFPDFTTTPQQDVSKPRQATKIHPVTDQRAQPLPALVQVNMHHHKVRTLPPKDASTEEVREYLYFVLGCDRFSYTAEEAPEAVTTTIIAYCTLNGQELRDMFKHKLWNEWCPAQW